MTGMLRDHVGSLYATGSRRCLCLSQAVRLPTVLLANGDMAGRKRNQRSIQKPVGYPAERGTKRASDDTAKAGVSCCRSESARRYKDIPLQGGGLLERVPESFQRQRVGARPRIFPPRQWNQPQAYCSRDQSIERKAEVGLGEDRVSVR